MATAVAGFEVSNLHTMLECLLTNEVYMLGYFFLKGLLSGKWKKTGQIKYWQMVHLCDHLIK